VNGSGNEKQVRDGDGANNGCETSGTYSNTIYKHRIVEEINWSPDQHGPWKFPT
jgi:hypothetical protein